MNAYCSQISQNAKEPLLGTAPHCPNLMLIECPLPWPEKALEAKFLPQGLKKVIKSLDVELRPQLIFTEETKKQGPYQIFFCHGQDGAYQSYKYEIPLLDKITNLIQDHFSCKNRPKPSLMHHILVCAHAMRDRCCGKFGTSAYKEIKKFISERQINFSVWKTSHLGGHRFAPTLLTLPSGRMYGRVEIKEIATLMEHIEKNIVYSKFYRGLALLKKTQQIAEGFAWNHSSLEKLPIKITVNEKGQYLFSCIQYPNEKEMYRLKLHHNKNKYEVLGSCKDSSSKFVSTYEIENVEKIQ